MVDSPLRRFATDIHYLPSSRSQRYNTSLKKWNNDQQSGAYVFEILGPLYWLYMHLLTIWWLIIIILMCCQPRFAPGRFAPSTFCIVYCNAWQARSSMGHKRDVCKNGNTATILDSLESLNIIMFRKTKFCD